jgi:precorrin-6B methylase 2
MEAITKTQVDPSKIMQVGTGFMATKTLLTAVNMELFTILATRELSGTEIQSRLGLHTRSIYDFLDALVALGFLKRKGLKESSSYSNADDADMFLDKNKQSYIGGILEMCNNRLYPFWNDLEEGLKTGLPQNETKDGGKPIFEEVYADPKKLREFVSAMGGVQMGNFMEFAKKFDFTNYKTLCDVGGAGGFLAAHVSIKNQHMQCSTFDLPPVEPIAKENIKNLGLESKVKVLSGDFFTVEFPKADIITMGNILHDWGTEDKKMLIKKAYDALPKGGALVIIENIIDDNRSENTFGLLMSLNMLIETSDGYDFSAADFSILAKEIGFQKISILKLTGPTSAVIAYK